MIWWQVWPSWDWPMASDSGRAHTQHTAHTQKYTHVNTFAQAQSPKIRSPKSPKSPNVGSPKVPTHTSMCGHTLLGPPSPKSRSWSVGRQVEKFVTWITTGQVDETAHNSQFRKLIRHITAANSLSGGLVPPSQIIRGSIVTGQVRNFSLAGMTAVNSPSGGSIPPREIMRGWPVIL